ncbi:MAG: PDZ domain-containing protein [Planctomycetota bacterium]|nr:PDZ domain-containing protein [Planctomycetota bacterium]
MMHRTLLAGLLALLLVGAVAAEESAPARPAPADALVAATPWRALGPANMGGRITALAVVESDPSTWWAATASGGLVKTVDDGITFEHQFDREAVVSIGDVAVSASNPEIVWVGTGECNPRNSVSWGNGVYKSIDGGKTWALMGLGGSFQISAVCIHPKDPQIVYVGACGRLWGPNEERGLFKTVDGGTTWERVHFVDERTGVIDVQMHPTDPETLLVATWERARDLYCTNHPAVRWGPGSGLWKTTDGGRSMRRITTGLPTCAIGRIGLDWFRQDPQHVYMVLESEKIGQEPPNAAFLGVNGADADVGARLSAVTKDGPAAAADLRVGDIVVAVDGRTVQGWGELVKSLRRHVAGDKVTLEISRDRQGMEIELVLGARPAPTGPAPDPNDTAPRGPFGAFLAGQQANMQDQQGAEGHEFGGIYHSADAGDTWTRINSLNPRPMYFSEIRVDPQDRARLWVLGIRLWKSADGGATFTPDGHPGDVHVDHHALWIDPTNTRHMILGNDGGIYVSRDRGVHYDHLNHVAIGQFYDVGIGPRRDYLVYGGLQDNGSWGGPARVAHGGGPTNESWFRVGGGDGFRVRVDPEDAEQLYFESQNGAVARYHLGDGSRGMMRPNPPKGERYRWNWYTPFVLSHHNTRIYYTAGNRVFRSLNRGKELRPISPDITATDRGSATALAEAPLSSDVLYVGTDDGALWISRDGGQTWTDLYAPEQPTAPEPAAAADGADAGATNDEAGADAPTDNEAADGAEQADTAEERKGQRPRRKGREKPAPKVPGLPLLAAQPDRRYVSWIEPSRHSRGRAYVVFDAHRSDDDRALIFVTEDEGHTWRSLSAGVPPEAGTTRVLREDLVREDVLWLGTEMGAYVSVDRGATWISLRTNLPTVAVHQFAQHTSSGEIVVGTHGRSLWALDATIVRQMTAETLGADAHLYRPANAVQWRPQPSRGHSRTFRGENPPSAARLVYSLKAKVDKAVLEVRALDGRVLRTLEGKPDAGTHAVLWDLRADPRPRQRFGPRVDAGTYRVALIAGERTLIQDVLVERDPGHADSGWMPHQDAAEEAEAARAEHKKQRVLPGGAGRAE